MGHIVHHVHRDGIDGRIVHAMTTVCGTMVVALWLSYGVARAVLAAAVKRMEADAPQPFDDGSIEARRGRALHNWARRLEVWVVIVTRARKRMLPDAGHSPEWMAGPGWLVADLPANKRSDHHTDAT